MVVAIIFCDVAASNITAEVIPRRLRHSLSRNPSQWGPLQSYQQQSNNNKNIYKKMF